jgi:hypothetical protein
MAVLSTKKDRNVNFILKTLKIRVKFTSAAIDSKKLRCYNQELASYNF